MITKTRLGIGLVLLAVCWPLVLVAAVTVRATGGDGPVTALVYVVASRLCHQQPSRSFATAGVQWPVCGRCSGLYASAAVGALLAGWRLRRLQLPAVWLLTAAAAPTALTLVLEWTGLAPIGNATRAFAAVPLGATAAVVVLSQLAERRLAIAGSQQVD